MIKSISLNALERLFIGEPTYIYTTERDKFSEGTNAEGIRYKFMGIQ